MSWRHSKSEAGQNQIRLQRVASQGSRFSLVRDEWVWVERDVVRPGVGPPQGKLVLTGRSTTVRALTSCIG